MVDDLCLLGREKPRRFYTAGACVMEGMDRDYVTYFMQDRKFPRRIEVTKLSSHKPYTVSGFQISILT